MTGWIWALVVSLVYASVTPNKSSHETFAGFAVLISIIVIGVKIVLWLDA